MPTLKYISMFLQYSSTCSILLHTYSRVLHNPKRNSRSIPGVFNKLTRLTIVAEDTFNYFHQFLLVCSCLWSWSIPDSLMFTCAAVIHPSGDCRFGWWGRQRWDLWKVRFHYLINKEIPVLNTSKSFGYSAKGLRTPLKVQFSFELLKKFRIGSPPEKIQLKGGITFDVFVSSSRQLCLLNFVSNSLKLFLFPFHSSKRTGVLLCEGCCLLLSLVSWSWSTLLLLGWACVCLCVCLSAQSS